MKTMRTRTPKTPKTTKTQTTGRRLVLAVMGVLGVLAAHSEIVGIEVKAGDNPPTGAGRIIAAQAFSDGPGDTLKISIVSPFEWEYLETAVVTNYTYRPAASNVQYTATETLWRAFSTNAYSVATGSVVAVSYVTNVANVVTGTVWSASTGLSNLTHTVTNVVALTNAVPLVRTGITSNLLAQAWGAKPYVANWNTNDLLYVSQSLTRALSSNVTYQVVDTVNVRTASRRSVNLIMHTNELWSVAPSYHVPAATNLTGKVIFPGDFIVGEFGGDGHNKVQLLIER